MGDIRRVLIVGGGVGGLTAAASFAHLGVEVVLIEKRSAFDIPGVGLGQPANALRIYQSIGVLDEVLQTGFSYDRMHIFDASRNLIAEHIFCLGDSRIPAFCALSRRELHRILLGAAERAGARIRLGITISEINEEPGGVHVRLSNGEQATFDLIAGFDGVRSTTREYLVGNAFAPRPTGYGAWRVQAPRRDYVRGMEFLQGVGSKTGAMPLNKELMYVFHIRPELPDARFDESDYAALFKERVAQYGTYVAEISASLDDRSEIVYSPIETLLLPWPWFKGRVVIGGDAAHTFPPHLTQGAAMAAEDGYVLARELLRDDSPMDTRLIRYSKQRYARCAFVYTFSRQWMDDEQSVRTAAQMEAARAELALNASTRITASDRILNSPI